ncbi:MAG: hypothetical protein VYE16_04505 [Cyanobacteriota bacterium]|nr:hypothetical protein [Cyanobacteriota bacterium]
MRVGAGMLDSDVDTPGLGLVREPVSDAIEFFVTLEAALALVWHSWDDDAREAAALAGCFVLFCFVWLATLGLPVVASRTAARTF